MPDLFGDQFDEVSAPKDVNEVLEQLNVACHNCRLGKYLDPANNGLLWSGTPEAKVAFLTDMPEIEGTVLSKRVPVAGNSGRVLSGIIQAMDLQEDEIFVTSVVQCRTEKGIGSRKKKKKGGKKELDLVLPQKQEIETCFPNRPLQVLRAMPNLEVLVTLGWTAAAAVLGREPEPREKSHEGQWFGSHLLPGVAVFCLDHPRFLGSDADSKKIGKLGQWLLFFRNEYTSSGQILTILKACAENQK